MRSYLIAATLLVGAGLVLGGAFLFRAGEPSVLSGDAPAAPSVAATDLGTFPFLAPDGKKITIADFRGKAVLLNVWATWCPPCRTEMPSLDRLQAAKGGPDFEVVALSIDNGGMAQVKPFYDEIGITKLAIYLDQPAAVMQAIKLPGLPTTLLIGSDGRELKRWMGPKEWDSPEAVAEIDALLATAAID